MNLLLTVLRHFVAVVLGWLTTVLPFTPEQVADVEAGLTAFGMALMLAGYAAAEKLLKPIWQRLLKEQDS